MILSLIAAAAIVIATLLVWRLIQIREGKTTTPPPAAAGNTKVGQPHRVVQSAGMNNGDPLRVVSCAVTIQPTMLKQLHPLAQHRSSIAKYPIRNMNSRGQWTPSPRPNNILTSACTTCNWPYGQGPPTTLMCTSNVMQTPTRREYIISQLT